MDVPNSSKKQFYVTNPNVAKAGGLQSQGVKGEVVVVYRDPFTTQDLKSSGFPDVLGRSRRRRPKGKQQGKIDPILRIHRWDIRETSHFSQYCK